MSLHADLLDPAEQLAQLDPRRPKQANLRRAVSSAYYALFHLLALTTHLSSTIRSEAFLPTRGGTMSRRGSGPTRGRDV